MTTVRKALNALKIDDFVLSGEPSNEAEFNASFKKVTGSDSNDYAVLSSTPSDFGVTWSQLLAKRNELEAAEPLKLLREERNRKLAKTDWMAGQDRTMSQAEKDYRQALRDITNSYTSLDDVVWPTKP